MAFLMCTEFLVPQKWHRQDYQYVVILLNDFMNITQVFVVHKISQIGLKMSY